jgi:hypothetical protein
MGLFGKGSKTRNKERAEEKRIYEQEFSSTYKEERRKALREQARRAAREKAKRPYSSHPILSTLGTLGSGLGSVGNTVSKYEFGVSSFVSEPSERKRTSKRTRKGRSSAEFDSVFNYF